MELFMQKQSVVQNLFDFQRALSPQIALLQVGQGDEALRYFARVVRVANAQEYLVYLAQSSLLLDLVRLKRALLVHVDFAHEGCFDAELCLTNLLAPSSDDCALSLSIIGPRPMLASDSEQFCPIT